MERLAAIVADYYPEEHLERIRAALSARGFSARFYKREADFLPDADRFEIVYGEVSPAMIRASSRARWFCSNWAGVASLCEESLYASPEIMLSNTSGGYGPVIAEHLIMVCLMVMRIQPRYSAMINARQWYHLPDWIGTLENSRITVLGTGDLGSEFCKRARGFSPKKITGIRRNTGIPNPLFDEICGVDELDRLLPETDLLVMCLPDTSGTKNVMDRKRIFLLPQGSYLVNVGRSTTIDQDALVDALNSGHLAGASLDVVNREPLPPEHPLWDTKNLLLTPHIAGIMNEPLTVNRCLQSFLDDFERYCDGLPPLRLVDRAKGY